MGFKDVSKFFLITSKPELVSTIKEWTDDRAIIHLLTKDTLFEYRVRHSNHTSPEVHAAKIRIIFLLQLYDDYVQENDMDEIAEIVSKLLAPIPIEYKVFDKWWEIVPLDIPEISTEIINDADISSLKNIAQTSLSGVDTWLSDLIKNKQSSEKE